MYGSKVKSTIKKKTKVKKAMSKMRGTQPSKSIRKNKSSY